ncbi:type II secretion system F family protein [Streptomyces flavofungini]|uniref:Type II secretion system F family protein n=1 Tax=Streptomyces flavofungini TaxID=68200 RepID=A0ABS0XH98_9ACTN|nr:type II secretion system F family protein [Streptomyces flavofungini]MBJ3812356.1 type II secretion system F family protein [Streptomyces flavofungini]GHC88258.1 membrane protein [Streptomyces flavofungini]
MSSDQWNLLAALCGALIVGGLLVAAQGFALAPVAAGRRPSRWVVRWQRAQASLPEAWAARYRLIAWAAGAATVGGWLYWQRPVHGLLAGVAVLGIPWIWNPAGTSERQIVRLEAMAEWMQQLAGVHEAGGTLDSSITTSAPRAPTVIRPQVRLLAARLRVGATPSVAYRQFADEFADGAVDNAVMLFLTHAQEHGPGLSRALQSMASLTEQEAIQLRTVDAKRSQVRTGTRWISVITLLIAAYIFANPSWGEIYRTATGQGVMFVLATVFAAALAWMRKLAQSHPAPRLLDPLPAPAADPRRAAQAPGGEATRAARRKGAML